MLRRLNKVGNIVRTHPKKIVFFGTLLGLGANFVKKKYDEECLMRSYCEEALRYGEVPQPLTDEGRHITVILNPAACNNKGKSKYEKYCAPLLHLAGLKVALVRTEHEDQAKQIMDVMDNTSAVVVAGGDGTLLEILTGLLRRDDVRSAAKRFPLGILPLGETNTAASSIWNFNKKPEVKHLAEATMAIVRNLRRPFDVVEVTPYDEEIGSYKKPIYAASQMEWGAFRDAADRKSVYWYWSFLKKYMVYVFSSYKDLSWNCAAVVEYSLPCKGCSRCVKIREEEEEEAKQQMPKRWWHAFVPRTKTPVVQEEQVDYSSVINEECGRKHQLTLENVSDVSILSRNTRNSSDLEGHSLSLRLGRPDLSSTEFIREGWRRERGEEASCDQAILVGELTLTPSDQVRKNDVGEPRQFNIDSEVFEVRPLKVRPKPSAVSIFAPPQSRHLPFRSSVPS